MDARGLTATMRVPDRFRRLIETLLPWYDPDLEAMRAQRSEAIHAQSIAVRQQAERELANASAASIRRAYRAYGHRVNGRG